MARYRDFIGKVKQEYESRFIEVKRMEGVLKLVANLFSSNDLWPCSDKE